ncbi:MAG: SDR family NAD(P)-dependent oxidoreductase, partial [Saprospiraceae bacterium]|nr:SDR family NAD(P)-dependent oxidoreductase [Saprospiraceae bacterium]
MKTILITGGAGFIGSNLTKTLLDQGHQIVCLDNFNDFYDPDIKQQNILPFVLNNRYSLVQGDLRNSTELKNLFADHPIDVVIHLAAQAGVRPSIENPQLYYDVNVMGTVNLLEAMRSAGCTKMIFGSSSSVYGNNEKVPFSESDPVDNPISPYAATKKAGELLCHTFHHLYGMDILCLRFFTVYGPSQRPEMAIPKFTQAILEGRSITMFGDGNSERDYTYVGDIVQGIVLAMDKVKGFDIINLGESKTIPLKNQIQLIEKETGRMANIQQLPMQPGDVQRTNADISRAKEFLGYDPKVDIETGIRNYVAWHIENVKSRDLR